MTTALERYGAGVPEVVRNTFIRGMVSGQSNAAIADAVLQQVNDLPVAYAHSLMRSLPLTSYRDAAVIHQLANADILEDYVIRIAALDGRTCLSCISLHGTRLPLGARVDDHRSGRCASISPVRGRTYAIRQGADWFAALPEDDQRQRMGHAAYEAMRAGRVQLRDFVQLRQDPLFGQVVTEASLKGLLGDDARQYYLRQR
jgi:hypothetical protein